PPLAFLRDLGKLFVTRLCATPDLEEVRGKAAVDLPAEEAARRALAVPAMPGAEYVDAARIEAWWREMQSAFAEAIAGHDGTVQRWAARPTPAWSLAGPVSSPLAETRQGNDEAPPFPSLAPFTTRLSARSKAQHLPLSRALGDASARKDRSALLSLLVPV